MKKNKKGHVMVFDHDRRGGSSGHTYRNNKLEGMDKAMDLLQTTIEGLLTNISPEISCSSVSDIYKLSIALSSLSRARTEQEKLRIEADGLFNEATTAIYQEIHQLMREEPELCEKLAGIIQKNQENVKLLGE